MTPSATPAASQSGGRQCGQSIRSDWPASLAPAAPVDEEPLRLRRPDFRRTAARPRGGLDRGDRASSSSAPSRASSISSMTSATAKRIAGIPVKSRRPIASGALSPAAAAVAATVIGVAAIGVGFWINRDFGIVSLTYLTLLTLYSVSLKHMVILDVLTIAGGFVLRALGGAVAIQVEFSHWLLLLMLLARAVSGAEQAAGRARDARRRRQRPPPEPRRIQPVPARPDDRRRDGVHPARLRVLHDCAGDGGRSSAPIGCSGPSRFLCTGSSDTCTWCTSAREAATRRSCCSRIALCSPAWRCGGWPSSRFCTGPGDSPSECPHHARQSRFFGRRPPPSCPTTTS